MDADLPFAGAFPGTAHCLQVLDAQVPFGLWVGDAAGRVNHLSPAFLELAGVRLADQALPGWAAGLAAGEAAEARAEWGRCRAEGAPWEREFLLRPSDGAPRHVLSRGTPLRGAGGRIRAWVGLNLDVSGIREGEGEIRRFRERVLMALCAGGDFLYESDPGAGSRRWFGPLEDLLGMPAPSGPGGEGDWRARIHPEDRPRVDRAMENPGPEHRVEYRLRRADGAWLSLLDRGRRVPGGSGPGGYRIGIVADRTGSAGQGDGAPGSERAAAPRMEIVGRLAGGIAHDFNNLLTAINGFSELLVNVLEDEGHRSYAKEILRAGERAAETTRQLLAFSRRQILAPRVLDLNAAVRDLALTLHAAMGADLSIPVRHDPLGALIKADPAQVEQLLSNLASHALDSGVRPARMAVEIGRGEDPERYVQMTVTQGGPPLGEEEREHLFEPFFPMRGRRLGLGLPAVSGIVEQNGGRVTVAATPGGGTVFRILWPRWTGETGSFPPA